ncbi:MAG TPA: NAD(P)H-dependent oxidoreductase [Jatrophihabitantaceae bacterium]
MPRLLIVTASTRPGRVGPAITEWFAGLAREHGGFDLEIADLAELDLPFHDEPAHPRLGKYEHDHTKQWSAIVDRADAVVFVMPEYNYSFSAPLKNAFDYLHHEWRYKPVGFVSYGGVSGGLRAVQQFKQVVTTLTMLPVPVQVAVQNFPQYLHEGRFEPDEGAAGAAKTMLDELAHLAPAMAQLRAA